MPIGLICSIRTCRPNEWARSPAGPFDRSTHISSSWLFCWRIYSTLCWFSLTMAIFSTTPSVSVLPWQHSSWQPKRNPFYSQLYSSPWLWTTNKWSSIMPCPYLSISYQHTVWNSEQSSTVLLRSTRFGSSLFHLDGERFSHWDSWWSWHFSLSGYRCYGTIR